MIAFLYQRSLIAGAAPRAAARAAPAARLATLRFTRSTSCSSRTADTARAACPRAAPPRGSTRWAPGRAPILPAASIAAARPCIGAVSDLGSGLERGHGLTHGDDLPLR